MQKRRYKTVECVDRILKSLYLLGRGARRRLRGSLVNFRTGGLSGKPLTRASTEVIRYISEKSKGAFPIIGVGGIHSPEDAIDKINAGAELVQLYTGFIYEGPGLISRINKKILSAFAKQD